MCAPAGALAALGFAVSVAQGITEYAAQVQDYNKAETAWQANYVNSLSAAVDEQKALQLRTMQEQDASAQRQHLINVETATAGAEARVRANSAGVGGISVDNIVRDIQRVGATNRAIDDANYRATAQQLTAEMGATNTRATNRINSMTRPTKPSLLGTIFKIAGAGINAFGGM